MILSIITRVHPKRPELFAKCKESVSLQTDKDFEQLFIYDDSEKGRGREYAVKMFFLKRDEIDIKGDYVMVLDDDDIMVYNNFVKDLKEITKPESYDMIIFKGELVGLGIVPSQQLWRKPPQCGGIASFCVVVKKELWDKYIEEYGKSPMAGDFVFFKKCYDNSKKVYWFDKLVCKTQKTAVERRKRVNGICREGNS